MLVVYVKGILVMIIELFFIIGGISMFFYAIKQKDNGDRTVKFPVLTGIALLLFGTFYYFDNKPGSLLTGIAVITLSFGNNLLKKFFKDKSN
ncbi:hypothetical protein [Fredinandcohnia quinoae]|uniref:Uncharacterized protein n=1 Tax=Fredinandcohnia quinoae TaxID=2918902 RepID=A0AAW5DX83_9BACI|nr:hypothetical protein [Fredinandcohnia sp. SECRCQ15]MCH1625260.1 hypothetical protein [Fredinandcohnia sp. SECRCQ15]